jgi:hypothetical protein
LRDFLRLAGKPAGFVISGLMAVVFLCAGAGTAHCTSIVAVRTTDEVYIGTDSMIKIERDRGAKQCKIEQVDDLFLVFSGVPVVIKAKFNAYELARKSFGIDGTVAERVAAYERDLKPQLENAIDVIKQTDMPLYNKWYAEDVVDRVALQAIIAGSENGAPVLFLLEYRIISPKGAPIKLQSFRKDFIARPTSGRAQIFFIGLRDAIDELLAKKDFFSDFDAVKSINEWIKAEIKAEPKNVSAPVDILKITGTKAEWVQHKPQCPEITPYTPKVKAVRK